MRIEVTQVRSFRIFDAPKLDPIFVVMHDLGSGCGRLVIECYGDAWAAYWGAMGERNVETFILSCSADYIANKLWPSRQKRTKVNEAYLLRLTEAVQAALRSDSASQGKP